MSALGHEIIDIPRGLGTHELGSVLKQNDCVEILVVKIGHGQILRQLVEMLGWKIMLQMLVFDDVGVFQGDCERS